MPEDILGAYTDNAVSEQQRYVQNLDLEEGEAYLNKLLFAICDLKLSDLELQIAANSVRYCLPYAF